MDKTLAARLSRIRSAYKSAPAPLRPSVKVPVTPISAFPPGPESSVFGPEWEDIAPFVRSRLIPSSRSFSPSDIVPSLSVLCSGSARAFLNGASVPLERLLFFDLETTGLSSGAGTVAFLAAFARYERTVPSEPSDHGVPSEYRNKLRIRQYLLLDYPGEPDFLECVLREFENDQAESVLVSYNGRSFDMQILRTRCLMNACRPPDPPHLDLVYPARRLWRRSLENCSLSTIEREALGVDRGDDLPGSQAPDAWFDFVKRGDSSRLLRICEHNARDLEGLAALLDRVTAISIDPLAALSLRSPAPIDPEGVALRWAAAAKAARASDRVSAAEGELREKALSLLEYAVAAGSARAAFVLAGECALEADYVRAAALRTRVARAEHGSAFSPPSPGLRAAACRILALDAVRRLRDLPLALKWADEGLSVPALPEGARRALEKLRERLN